MLVLCNFKKAKGLEQSRTFLTNCSVHLFRNDIVPDGNTLAGAFQEPAFDQGYQVKSPIAWTLATLNGQNQGQMDAPVMTWNFALNGGNFEIFGYFVTDNADGGLVYSERATVPISVKPNATQVSLALRYLHDTLD